MGLFGGYKLVDFRGADLSSTPTEVANIYRRAHGLLVKRFVACNFSINGEVFGETDMAQHKDENGNLICEVGAYVFTITPQDMVSVSRETGSIVSVSATGTATDTISYITVDGVEKKIAGGAVNSVNSKTGAVVLTADDIEAHNTQTVQENLERIDGEVEGVIDDLAGKQNTLVAGSNITITPLADGTARISSSGGGGGGTEYYAGNGINITGDTISIDEQVVAEKTDLPTKTSDLTNDSGFITSSYHDATKLDASKTAVSNVGGLVTPSATISSTELVAIGSGNAQERVLIGSGLQLTGSTSPKTLSATGGGGPAQYLKSAAQNGNCLGLLDQDGNETTYLPLTVSCDSAGLAPQAPTSYGTYHLQSNNGTISWAQGGSGGGDAYNHFINWFQSGGGTVNFQIVTNSATPFTPNTLAQGLTAYQYLPASGAYVSGSGTMPITTISKTNESYCLKAYGFQSSCPYWPVPLSGYSFTDTVKKI
ncbi:MAG: hypothetical protein MJZ20_09470 [Bacteroidaceae bacterium]|nr:hypothetical protein [Bacteroidaceae bacterium]